jgi:hypothetical protein
MLFNAAVLRGAKRFLRIETPNSTRFSRAMRTGDGLEPHREEPQDSPPIRYLADVIDRARRKLESRSFHPIAKAGGTTRSPGPDTTGRGTY